MIGEALGNYRLVARLGSGSMGVVYLGEHQRLGRRVAIKLLAPELVQNQQALQRFFNEARATSSIRHPGIVDVFDCDVDPDGRAYMVMEHLQGETLGDRLRGAGKLAWTEACLVAAQVADAVGAAHALGIVHRDLKPENVFLVADPREGAAAVKVLDFGVAKLLAGEAGVRLTMRGMLVGTPEYMSPEQCVGSDVDHRTDVYALGCILFEMLAGQPPFVRPSVREVVTAQRFRSPPPLQASGAEVPAWLSNLLASMLAKEPAGRPSSMREMACVLRERDKTRSVGDAPLPGPAGADRELSRTGLRSAVQRPGGRLAVGLRRLGARRAKVVITLGAALAVTAVVWAVHGGRGDPRGRGGAGVAVTGGATTHVSPPPRSPAREAERAEAQVLSAAGPPPLPASPAAASGLNAGPSPLGRRPQGGERATRRVRPAATHPRQVVDTDGIVDL